MDITVQNAKTEYVFLKVGDSALMSLSLFQQLQIKSGSRVGLDKTHLIRVTPPHHPTLPLQTANQSVACLSDKVGPSSSEKNFSCI